MFKPFTQFFVALIAVVALAGCSESNEPQAGVQYEALPAALTEYNLSPVTEIFSLNCGHCRTMETAIPEIEALTNQKIGKVHVTFNESAQISAMIFYTAVMQLNDTPDHAFMDELFGAVQMGGDATPEARQQALETAFTSRGLVSPYQLDKEQQAALFEYVQKAEEISVKGQINSVPTFIVNGKYQVLTAGHQDLAGIGKTINYLLTQP
ncbi:thiol:disulfide interchange protein DsbA/DsbL [Vibrio sp. D404a]|uniref:thiol:disulfide interchange protein DsbA/DsbL n=1 Tax=unclassified Vibrio TaxID=2614977 RepID=UPI0025578565|nr:MULTISPECIES: thiol:disulfide interchange protein DsbA/DsbL [unclassified Vibrio]MDK9738433.1 thiol:disulfide interchange protein DsbA/DsbL [Vibrio sp. D404a]MDK9796203.1 thiol:disulfide interchange protein DsbA/DsbL [Vibrio sp. D449a]